LSAALQTTTPLQFLDDVATAALKGRESVTVEAANNLPARPPLHAQKFLQRLVSLPDTRSVAQALQPLLRRVAEISRLRRAAIVAGCLVLPVLATSMMFVGAAMMETWNARVPGLMELNMLLHHRDNARRWMKDEKRPTDEQFAIYIAHHHRSIITNDARWTDMLALSVITGDRRRFAERSVAEHPSPTSEEVAAADAAIKPLPLKSSGFGVMNKPWFPLMAGGATLAIYVAIPALIAALLFRGGLILLATGVTFVRRDGARASRLRVFGRSLIAWSPLLVALFVFGLLAVPLSKLAAAVLAALFICIPAVISIVLPNRGLADRLAGTWPVPR
jgi:hypothetical protein